MKRKPIYLILSLFFICSCTGRYNTSLKAEYQPYLTIVDSALSHHQEYVDALIGEANMLRQQLQSANTDEQRYVLCDLLSSKYYYLNSDSALLYLGEKEKLAIKTGRKDWLTEVHVSRGNLYTQIGLLSKGADDLKVVNPQDLPDNIKGQYYSTLIFQETQQTRLSGSASAISGQLGDSLMKYADSADEMTKYWGLFFTYREADRSEKLLSTINQIYQQYKKDGSPLSGSAAYMISDNYRETDDTQHWMEYLCKSAADNIQYVNRDHTALLELISYLIAENDINRAYRYINYIMDIQQEYPDHVRSIQMGQYLERVFYEMQQFNNQQQRTIKGYLYALVITLIILIIALIFQVRLKLKERRHKKEIAEANVRLSQNIVELKTAHQQLEASHQQLVTKEQQLSDTNAELTEANYVKEEYIGQLFATCSTYLDKMDTLKKNINRKLKAGMYADAIKQTSATSQKDNEDLQELWEEFDTVFLRLFPRFVQQFNSLLRPEEQIVVKQDGRLNTDLRIYALIRLGIDSSVKISKMLGVSTQTVYNARTKINAKATASDEDFDLRVRQLKPTMI